MNTLSLIGYCEHCFKNNQPMLKTPFVVYGSHQKKFHIYFIEKYGVRGFTPHIVQLLKVVGNGDIIYQQACGICDVNIYEPENGTVHFTIQNWERKVCTIEEWNSWVKYHSDKDYFI